MWDRIVMTGFVDDADLAPLYTGALAFVYPSLYEGFGLPVLGQCNVVRPSSRPTRLPCRRWWATLAPWWIRVTGQRSAERCSTSTATPRCGASEASARCYARAFSWERVTQRTLDAHEAKP